MTHYQCQEEIPGDMEAEFQKQSGVDFTPLISGLDSAYGDNYAHEWSQPR